VFGATPAWSETNGTTVNEFRSAAVSGETATNAAPSTRASAITTRRTLTESCSPILTLLRSDLPQFSTNRAVERFA
jgi:hypothetical protein